MPRKAAVTRASGVDYHTLDYFKRSCLQQAVTTDNNVLPSNLRVVEWTCGESVFLLESLQDDFYLGHVHEGLGTKNLVADMTGNPDDYWSIAQDTVAMIVNDMVTLGVQPMSVAMHLAVGDSAWFNNTRRSDALVRGWADACRKAGCAWGGGETPELRDIIVPGTAEISGSAVGIIRPKSRLIKADIRHGDAIVLLGSSGIHANGLTKAREVARRIRHGYASRLPSSRQTFGQALLTPTQLYVRIIQQCLDAALRLRYCVNITGHGWLKLMRRPEPFSYIIERVPTPQPEFRFIQKHAGLSDRQMYAAFNMGTGFAVYVHPGDAQRVVSVARNNNITAIVAGTIHVSKQRMVHIQPKHLRYSGDELQVR